MTDRPPFWDRVTDEQEATRLSLCPAADGWPQKLSLARRRQPGSAGQVEQGLLRAKVVLADGPGVRQGVLLGGDEFLDFHHLLSGEPARYSVEALEPCRLQLFQLADLRQLSCWSAWYQHLLAVQLRIKEEKELLLLTESPQARYSTSCRCFRHWMPGCRITRSPPIWGSPHQPQPHSQTALKVLTRLMPPRRCSPMLAGLTDKSRR